MNWRDFRLKFILSESRRTEMTKHIIMNRINTKLEEGKKLLSIYFTAGYPKLEDTTTVIEKLVEAGVDMIEIGLPLAIP